MVPNYHRDVGDTFRKTALSLIRTSKSLNIWTGDQRKKERKSLPSWVPDWSATYSPADCRRLETLGVYDIHNPWTLLISKDEKEYWTDVKDSVQQLRVWLEQRVHRPHDERRRELPMIFKSARSLGADLLRSNEEHQDELSVLMRTIGKELYTLIPFFRRMGRRKIPLSRVFRWTNMGGNIQTMVPTSVLLPSSKESVPRNILIRYFERNKAKSLSSKHTLLIDRILMDEVERVGPPLWNWTDVDAAQTLLDWIKLFCDGLCRTELDRSALFQFAQTMVSGVCVDDMHSRQAQDEDLPVLVDWLDRLLSGTYDFTRRLPQGCSTDPDQSNITGTGWIPLQQSIQRATESRVFFVTKTGLPGLGPPSTEPGDEINLLPGGKSHFILRPKRTEPKDYHGVPAMEVIGDCYWHGKFSVWKEKEEEQGTDESDNDEPDNDKPDNDSYPQGGLPFELSIPYLSERDIWRPTMDRIALV